MRKIPLILQILMGFVLGTLGGLFLSEWGAPQLKENITGIVSPFGNLLVAMLKMVVFPMILFSLIHGAASLPLRKSGKVGGWVMVWYFATSLFATLFGVVLASFLNPSIDAGTTIATGAADAQAFLDASTAGATSFATFIVDIFQNPFAALAQGEFLAIVVFAIAFGLAARCLIDEASSVSATVQKLIDAVDAIQRIMFRLTEWVIRYFPFGVFALCLVNFTQNGVLLFGPYLRIILSVVMGVLLMIFVIYPLALFCFCRENPFRILYRIRMAMLTAFVTRSSVATLPLSFKAMDGLRVNKALSSFSLPMGATVNMDGVCIHLPVFVILAVNLFGLQLSMVEIATLCLTILLASIGAGGIPGGSVFLLFMVLESMGLQADQVTLIVTLALGINPILDMFETCCNVTGDNVCTYIVAKNNHMIEEPQCE